MLAGIALVFILSVFLLVALFDILSAPFRR